jgi:hypothetical protein
MRPPHPPRPPKKILAKISNPIACNHVIAPNPKIVGISQFQSPITAKPAKVTNAAPITANFKPFKIQNPLVFIFFLVF